MRPLLMWCLARTGIGERPKESLASLPKIGYVAPASVCPVEMIASFRSSHRNVAATLWPSNRRPQPSRWPRGLDLLSRSRPLSTVAGLRSTTKKKVSMLISCWSVKGGVGTTVIAVTLAMVLAESSPNGSLLVDLAGDIPAVLGLSESTGPGVVEWLAAGSSVPVDGLVRLEQRATDEVALIHRGASDLAVVGSGRADLLAELLTLDPRPVVVDCGVLRDPHRSLYQVGTTLAASATQSWMITRSCYLALRHALIAPVRPSGVILVREPGRILRAADIEAVIQAPVIAEVAFDPAVARAVDAGLLASRLPRSLELAVRGAP